jgi:hypothetical protein
MVSTQPLVRLPALHVQRVPFSLSRCAISACRHLLYIHWCMQNVMSSKGCRDQRMRRRILGGLRAQMPSCPGSQVSRHACVAPILRDPMLPCNKALAQCNKALAQCNKALAQCNKALAQCNKALAQCNKALAHIAILFAWSHLSNCRRTLPQHEDFCQETVIFSKCVHVCLLPFCMALGNEKWRVRPRPDSSSVASIYEMKCCVCA